MPAIVRGGPRPSIARPKPKPPRQRARVQRPQPQAPSRLRVAQGIGLPPGWALSAAGGLVVVGLMVALFTGGRMDRIAAGFGEGLAMRLAGVGFRLTSVHVEGATKDAQADILRASGFLWVLLFFVLFLFVLFFYRRENSKDK